MSSDKGWKGACGWEDFGLHVPTFVLISVVLSSPHHKTASPHTLLRVCSNLLPPTGTPFNDLSTFCSSPVPLCAKPLVEITSFPSPWNERHPLAQDPAITSESFRSNCLQNPYYSLTLVRNSLDTI